MQKSQKLIEKYSFLADEIIQDELKLDMVGKDESRRNSVKELKKIRT